MTPEQANEVLSKYGINLPDFMLGGLLEQVSTIDDCLAAHYSDPVALLIKGYLLSLMGLGFGDKYVSSQTAPSGASQSFRYQDIGSRYKALLGLLDSLDKHGCAIGLIPPNPDAKAHGFILSAKAGCMRGGK